MSRNPSDLVRGSVENDAHRCSPVGEMPGAHEPAAPIVPAPGEHGHWHIPKRRKTRARQFGKVETGVLHHLDKLDAQILNHHPIDLAHLVRREGREVSRRDYRPDPRHRKKPLCERRSSAVSTTPKPAPLGLRQPLGMLTHPLVSCAYLINSQ